MKMIAREKQLLVNYTNLNNINVGSRVEIFPLRNMKSYLPQHTVIFAFFIFRCAFCDYNMIFNREDKQEELDGLKQFVGWYFERYTCLTVLYDHGYSESVKFDSYGNFSVRIISNLEGKLPKIDAREGFLIFSDTTTNICEYLEKIKANNNGIVKKTIIIISTINDFFTIFNQASELSFQYILVVKIDLNNADLCVVVAAYNYFSRNFSMFNISDYDRITSWQNSIDLGNREIRSVTNLFSLVDPAQFLASVYGKKLNFHISYYTYKLGEVNKTNNALHKLQNKEIDFIFSLLFVTDYFKDDFMFLQVMATDQLCVVVPKSTEFKERVVIPHSFTWNVWILLLLVFVMLLLSLYAISKVENLSRISRADCGKNFDYRIQTIIFDGLQVIYSMSPLFSSRKYPNRIVFMLILISFVILNTAFQSSLYKILTSPNKINTITTLKELSESGLVISTKSDNLKNTFALADRPYIRKIKLVLLERNQSRYPAYLEKYTSNIYQQMSEYRLYGDSLHYRIPECPKQYVLAQIARKDSILADAIGKINRYVNAHGLLGKWYSDVMRNVSMYTPFGKGGSAMKSTLQKKFQIRDFKFCFGLLAAGLVLSCLVCVVELFWGKWRSKNMLP